MVEHGLVTVRNGDIVSVQTRLCRPKARIRPEETAVHGIADIHTQGTEPFANEWDTIVSARRSGPLAAHNAGFENSLLKSEWPHPPFVPDFSRPGSEQASWGPWLDSCSLHRKLYPGIHSHGLEELISVLGLGQDLSRIAADWCPENRRRFHCAGFDAIACALLLIRLGKLPELAEAGWPDWLAWSSGGGNPSQAELFG